MTIRLYNLSTDTTFSQLEEIISCIEEIEEELNIQISEKEDSSIRIVDIDLEIESENDRKSYENIIFTQLEIKGLELPSGEVLAIPDTNFISEERHDPCPHPPCKHIAFLK